MKVKYKMCSVKGLWSTRGIRNVRDFGILHAKGVNQISGVNYSHVEAIKLSLRLLPSFTSFSEKLESHVKYYSEICRAHERNC